jgi:hypothetical protein
MPYSNIPCFERSAVRVGQGSSMIQEHLHVILKNTNTHIAVYGYKEMGVREGEFAWIFLTDIPKSCKTWEGGLHI